MCPVRVILEDSLEANVILVLQFIRPLDGRSRRRDQNRQVKLAARIDLHIRGLSSRTKCTSERAG